MSGKILIIKLGALGDVIMVTPHIQRILATHADEQIYLLTAPAYGPLFSEQKRLHIEMFPRKGVQAMFAAITWIRRQRFEIVYDLQGSERSAIMTLLSGAGKRVGLGFPRAYTHRPPSYGKSETERHIFDRLNRLMQRAGLDAAEQVPSLAAGPAERARVERWLAEKGLIEGAFVLMHAGSSHRWPSKRWPAAHFVELALKLSRRGLTTVWVGGEDEAELNADLVRQVGVDGSGRFSILELSELARHARFAVVNDSGPMHLISTAGIPVYAFFGPTNWRRSHAVGQEENILRNPVSCSPCHLPVCPAEREHRCLERLTPDDIFNRIAADGRVDPYAMIPESADSSLRSPP